MTQRDRRILQRHRFISHPSSIEEKGQGIGVNHSLILEYSRRSNHKQTSRKGKERNHLTLRNGRTDILFIAHFFPFHIHNTYSNPTLPFHLPATSILFLFRVQHEFILPIPTPRGRKNVHHSPSRFLLLPSSTYSSWSSPSPILVHLHDISSFFKSTNLSAFENWESHFLLSSRFVQQQQPSSSSSVW